MNIDLTDKHTLVCGSTQGIGRACAIELATLGAQVTLVARNPKTLKATCNALPTDAGQQHGYLVADFMEPALLETKIKAFISQAAPVHILINNTGGPPGGPVLDASIQAFHQAFYSHLVCNHILVQAVVAGMKEAGYGRIINIISTSVKQPISGLGVSNTTRGAVANWAKTLAGELGPFGITINNILPGATRTARLDAIIAGKAQKTGQSIDAVETAMQAIIPAGRFAETEEIAQSVAFLASPAASYINGINLPVDGGRTKCL